MSDTPTASALNAMSDDELMSLEWKELKRLSGRLLDLHAEGRLGNDEFAKLPLRPILCIDDIELIDDDRIVASFQFPERVEDWAYASDESLEMLFQDQLDQLVGFWGCRKLDGIGRALSSGSCQLYASLDFSPGKRIRYELDRKKWLISKDTGTGTAIFDGKILDENDNVVLDCKKIIVGILRPEDVHALRKMHGGETGVAPATEAPSDLNIPAFDATTIKVQSDSNSITEVTATLGIDPQLWPLRYHFRGDPVVPGNFGTHGMISLLKAVGVSEFGMAKPIFRSLASKKFSGMIFEDPKQIRFVLNNVSQGDDGSVVVQEASLYLEDLDANRMIDDPIYRFKGLTIFDAG